MYTLLGVRYLMSGEIISVPIAPGGHLESSQHDIEVWVIAAHDDLNAIANIKGLFEQYCRGGGKHNPRHFNILCQLPFPTLRAELVKRDGRGTLRIDQVQPIILSPGDRLTKIEAVGPNTTYH